MSLNNDDAVERKIGVANLRDLSREKMLALAVSIPEMTSEVRVKLIEQLPAFQKFAGDAVNAVESTFRSAMESNDASESEVHAAFADIRAALRDDLKRDDVSEEHRQVIYEKLIETGQASADKDSEGKVFKASQAAETRKAIAKLAGISVLAAVVYAGGKMIVDQTGSGQSVDVLGLAD